MVFNIVLFEISIDYIINYILVFSFFLVILELVRYMEEMR